MSIMDFFASQGTSVPSTGSSGGDWQDWFLDMKGRKPYGRTAYPDPDAERGDWIDWYLNREGPAGRFRGSRRPRYGINYLFNGGGSVKSKPSRNIGYDRAGPSQLERLLSNPQWNQEGDNRPSDIDPDILRNLQQAPGVIDHTIRNMQIPGEGIIKLENPRLPPWHPGNISDDSYWNVKYEPPSQDSDWYNSGVMAASNSNSWLEDNPWFLSIMAKRHGRPSDLEALEGLEDPGNNGGWLNANWGLDIGRNNFGVNATWPTPKWMGG